MDGVSESSWVSRALSTIKAHPVSASVVTGIFAVIVAIIQFIIGPWFMKWMDHQDSPPPIDHHRTDTTKSETDKPPEHHIQQVGRWTVTTLPVEDNDGHHGLVDIYILSNEYSWRCSSTDIVGINGTVESVAAHFQSAAMKTRITNKDAIIAVGAASHEGQNQVLEEDRAMARARQLAVWLRDSIDPLPPLYTLSLGQFTWKTQSSTPCSTHSESERPVVVLGISSEDQSFNMPTALRKAFDQPDFPLHSSSYSLFRLDRRS